ncbi:MAG: hypothetical protein NVSMB14_05100 [Isosphaeraceae bacterium]
MNASIEIPDEVAARLIEAADAKGISLTEFVADALVRAVVSVERRGNDPEASNLLDYEEWSRKFHELVDSFKHLKLPPIAPESWGRENIYEDRDA